MYIIVYFVGDYNKARQKLPLAEEISDLSTETDEHADGKRKRRQRSQLRQPYESGGRKSRVPNSSDDEREEESSESDFPEPPGLTGTPTIIYHI